MPRVLAFVMDSAGVGALPDATAYGDSAQVNTIGNVAEREKMPFEVTPFMPYLTRFSADSKPVAASTDAPSDPAPSVNAPAPSSPAPDQSTPTPNPQ